LQSYRHYLSYTNLLSFFKRIITHIPKIARCFASKSECKIGKSTVRQLTFLKPALSRIFIHPYGLCAWTWKEFLLNNRILIISYQFGTVTINCDCGLSTLQISSRQSLGSRICSKTSRQVALSKYSSGYGILPSLLSMSFIFCIFSVFFFAKLTAFSLLSIPTSSSNLSLRTLPFRNRYR